MMATTHTARNPKMLLIIQQFCHFISSKDIVHRTFLLSGCRLELRRQLQYRRPFLQDRTGLVVVVDLRRLLSCRRKGRHLYCEKHCIASQHANRKAGRCSCKLRVTSILSPAMSGLDWTLLCNVAFFFEKGDILVNCKP